VTPFGALTFVEPTTGSTTLQLWPAPCDEGAATASATSAPAATDDPATRRRLTTRP
jgi:hypothetical protein